MEKLFMLCLVLIIMLAIEPSNGCLQAERLALLDIKSFVQSHRSEELPGYHLLPSWADDPESECCGWERVTCNHTTGHVIKLSLDNLVVDYDKLGGYLNTSLFQPLKELRVLNLSFNQIHGFESLSRLKKLETLDLSYNSFNESIMPSLIGLPSLKNLILARNYFGSFPTQELDNFKSLEILDLSWNRSNGTLPTEGFCGLIKLVQLVLKNNHFSGPLPECISSNLTDLQVVDFSYNQLSGNIQSLSNLTNLQVLHLSHNQFSGSIESTISKLKSLVYLSLSGNEFEGLLSFSTLANHSKLEVFQISSGSSKLEVETEDTLWIPTFQLRALVLPNCNLNVRTSRTFPSFLLHQRNLTFIDLSHNKLVGMFPNWILLNNSKLHSVYLKNNSFSGTFQLPTFKLDSLQVLDISENNISGKLPTNIGVVLSNLLSINFYRNGFQGNVPSSIGAMASLQYLDFSSNNFSGMLPESLFLNCTYLTSLILSDNNFQGNITPKYSNLSLIILQVKNNNFSGIGEGLSRSFNLLILDISNNRISGELPIQLCDTEDLAILDLSQNRFSGFLPPCFGNLTLEFLFLQDNGLSGLIPDVFNSGLQLLDLRNNKFSGSIPHWINKFSEMHTLLLRGNQLQGYIPQQLCQLTNLNILDLSHNLLSGSIPSCFNNISFGLLQLSLDNYEYNTQDFFYPRDPSGINSTLELELDEVLPWFDVDKVEVEFTMKYRYNSYKGDIISLMSGLDLSSNKLSGDIPLELGHLRKILALNLSNNHLSGSIPVNFSNLKNLESLDLCNNNLSGEIPMQFVELNFLEIFDVSYNNLSGRIPDKAQFGTFDESSYKGNPGLCGELIHRSCNPEKARPLPPPSIDVANDEEGFIDMEWFYWSFSASYVTILLVLAAIFCINRHWRVLWFYYVHEFIYSIFGIEFY